MPKMSYSRKLRCNRIANTHTQVIRTCCCSRSEWSRINWISIRKEATVIPRLNTNAHKQTAEFSISKVCTNHFLEVASTECDERDDSSFICQLHSDIAFKLANKKHKAFFVRAHQKFGIRSGRLMERASERARDNSHTQ